MENWKSLMVIPVLVADQERYPVRTGSGQNIQTGKPNTCPQSSTSVVPLFVRTSTQEVLPPKSAVFGPGVGIEPRVPQKRRCIPITLSLFRRFIRHSGLLRRKQLMFSVAHFSVKHLPSSMYLLFRA